MNGFKLNIKYKLGAFFPVLKKINRMRKTNNTSIIILNYHGVLNEHKAHFNEQIQWLCKNYEIIDTKTFQSFLNKEIKLNGKKVLITFDDGFKSSYEVTKLFLDPLNIKATFFLPSNFVGDKNKNMWKNFVSQNIYKNKKKGAHASYFQEPMSDKEIKKLIDNGHLIGSHTLNHLDLNTILDENELKYELLQSKVDLERNYNININSLAYPFGGINHISEIALNKISKYYDFCYSNIRGDNYSQTSPFAIRRQDISPDIPLLYFGFIIEGGLNWYWYEHRKKLDKMVFKLNSIKI